MVGRRWKVSTVPQRARRMIGNLTLGYAFQGSSEEEEEEDMDEDVKPSVTRLQSTATKSTIPTAGENQEGVWLVDPYYTVSPCS